MITLSNINKIFRTKEIETLALDGINLTVRNGEFISIMGPSGCGKSTLLNIIGLLDEPSSGQIRIDDITADNMTDRELSRLRNEKFGFIFQSFHLIPALNILDNVEMPLLYRAQTPSRTERRERAEEVLEKVGLAHRMKHFPAQLSGGQCQRAAIARAIVGQPDIILADEPTGNLDSHMGNEIMDLLRMLNQEGTTLVMVTHDLRMAEQAGTQIRMSDGKIL